MARCHLIRVGAFGHVGRFVSLDARLFLRGSRVVVRTSRGLEIGEVLSPGEDVHRSRTDGVLLRGMTVEDELLEARLRRHKQRAFEACSARISALGLRLTLVDVEHLFDGQSLFFYFLGEQPPELGPLIDELAELYQAKVNFRRFAETLTAGCGPGCGTESAAGAGCTSCSSGCGVLTACARPRSV
jgi:cell fate regulator YaaT (PSP1 superfamily)